MFSVPERRAVSTTAKTTNLLQRSIKTVLKCNKWKWNGLKVAVDSHIGTVDN